METAGAVEELEMEGSDCLAVDLAIGGDLHRHD